MLFFRTMRGNVFDSPAPGPARLGLAGRFTPLSDHVAACSCLPSKDVRVVVLLRVVAESSYRPREDFDRMKLEERSRIMRETRLGRRLRSLVG